MALRHPAGAVGQVQQDTTALGIVDRVLATLADDRAHNEEHEPPYQRNMAMERDLHNLRNYLQSQHMGYLVAFAERGDTFDNYMLGLASDLSRCHETHDVLRAFELLTNFISVCSSRRHSLHPPQAQHGSASYSQPMPRAIASLYRRSHVRASVAGGKCSRCVIRAARTLPTGRKSCVGRGAAGGARSARRSARPGDAGLVVGRGGAALPRAA